MSKALVPIARGKKSTVQIEVETDTEVPVRNIGKAPQIFGKLIIRPNEVKLLPAALARALSRRPEFEIIWPKASECNRLQIQIYLGLGDNVFALAACYAYHQAHPQIEIYFDTHVVHKPCIDWIPFVKFGLTNRAETVNLTGIPQGKIDRTCLIGSMLGVPVTDIRFPIKVPKLAIVPDQPYWLFAPFNQNRGLRSFAPQTVNYVLKRLADYGHSIVLVDSETFPNNNCINLSGQTSIEELWALAQYAKGIISVDSGAAWVGAALGKPVLTFFGHFPARSLIMTAKTMWSVEPSVKCYPCYAPGPSPACMRHAAIPPCMNYKPELVLYKTLEFMGVSDE